MIINTIEVIRVTYSHLILSMAHSPAYNFQYVKCALPICAGFNASIRVMTIFAVAFLQISGLLTPLSDVGEVHMQPRNVMA